MQPQRHRHTDGHTHSMESWGNWGSVCVCLCMCVTKRQRSREKEKRMRMKAAQ